MSIDELHAQALQLDPELCARLAAKPLASLEDHADVENARLGPKRPSVVTRVGAAPLFATQERVWSDPPSPLSSAG